MTTERNEKPLIYACSGCSNVAQLANDLAVGQANSGSRWLPAQLCQALSGENKRDTYLAP